MAKLQTPLRAWGDASLGSLGGALLELAKNDNAFEHRRGIADFCALRWDIPLAFLVGYLAMVYAAARRPPPRAGAWADHTFAAWNLSLSLFSLWGSWQMGGWLWQAVEARGYFFTVCSDPFAFETEGKSHATLALVLFAFSKIPELGDTAFLILRGKQVRFLQWYHHSTVMLFCWLALATEYTPGIWFALTNYCVHAVMYMYFFLMAFSSLKRVVKVIAPVVTFIQIAQMVYGLFINGVAVWNYMAGGYCHIQDIAVVAAVVMYASYFVLFSHLFLESRRRAAGGWSGWPREAGTATGAKTALGPADARAAAAEVVADSQRPQAASSLQHRLRRHLDLSTSL